VLAHQLERIRSQIVELLRAGLVLRVEHTIEGAHRTNCVPIPERRVAAIDLDQKILSPFGGGLRIMVEELIERLPVHDVVRLDVGQLRNRRGEVDGGH